MPSKKYKVRVICEFRYTSDKYKKVICIWIWEHNGKLMLKEKDGKANELREFRKVIFDKHPFWKLYKVSPKLKLELQKLVLAGEI
jgi:hypothetical protein